MFRLLCTKLENKPCINCGICTKTTEIKTFINNEERLYYLNRILELQIKEYEELVEWHEKEIKRLNHNSKIDEKVIQLLESENRFLSIFLI